MSAWRRATSLALSLSALESTSGGAKSAADIVAPTSSMAAIWRWIKDTNSNRSRNPSRHDGAKRMTTSIGTSGPRCFSSHW